MYVNCPLPPLKVREGVPAEFTTRLVRGGTVGLFNITATPLDAFQSAFTCAAGMVGLLDRLV